jgi:hypothetical protein
MATILRFPIRTGHDMQILIDRGRDLIRHNGWGWRMVMDRVVRAEMEKQKLAELERKRKVELWTRWP